ncbi:MAG: hypothetical protein HQK76_04845 [Desulfobacterales bacterium]|nr:hypothetical protein [Desulfobacterales bacterium]
MKTIKDFFGIVDIHMIFVLILSLACTYLCIYFDFKADLPSNFVGIAVVFPVVFSINAAYKRREEALNYFADLKSNLIALYYAHRDWNPKKEVSTHKNFKEASLKTLDSINRYLQNSDKDKPETTPMVYTHFSKLSKLNEEMRSIGVPANEVSRANQYVRSVITDFEKMKNIYEYRTPIGLRAYSNIFLNLFPIVFGPFFAYLAQKFSPVFGYLFAALYSIVLISLQHIQDNLEDPFDGIGEDDIKLDIKDEYSSIMNED